VERALGEARAQRTKPQNNTNTQNERKNVTKKLQKITHPNDTSPSPDTQALKKPKIYDKKTPSIQLTEINKTKTKTPRWRVVWLGLQRPAAG